MKKTLPFLALLLLSACQIAFEPYWEDEIPPVIGVTASPVPQPANTTSVPQKTGNWQTYTSVGMVNIHAEPYFASPVVGVLYLGAKVRADCAREDDFCEVTSGYVIKACLGVGDRKCR